MKVMIALLLFVVTAAAAAQAEPHACAADAIAKADQLLRFHGEVQSGQPAAVDQNVKVLPPVKALKGNGRFDVLEVWGHIYKADYRMRLIYAHQRLTRTDGPGDPGSQRSLLSRLCGRGIAARPHVD